MKNGSTGPLVTMIEHYKDFPLRSLVKYTKMGNELAGFMTAFFFIFYAISITSILATRLVEEKEKGLKDHLLLVFF